MDLADPPFRSCHYSFTSLLDRVSPRKRPSIPRSNCTIGLARHSFGVLWFRLINCFPKPDLIPLRVSEHWLHEVKPKLPELLADRCERLVSQYGLRDYDKKIGEPPVSAERLGELVALINKGEISGKLAKEILPKMFETGDSASARTSLG